jgi:hypothetical protein
MRVRVHEDIEIPQGKDTHSNVEPALGNTGNRDAKIRRVLWEEERSSARRERRSEVEEGGRRAVGWQSSREEPERESTRVRERVRGAETGARDDRPRVRGLLFILTRLLAGIKLLALIAKFVS